MAGEDEQSRSAPPDQPEAMPDLPALSVVIPSFARPERLRLCLRALACTTYPRDRLEVLVVDDGSPQPVAEMLGDAASGLALRIMRQENQGPAVARNQGVRAASGEVIAFTDDDCLPDPDWLPHLARRVHQAPDALVGGLVANALPDNVYAEASQELVDFLNEYFGANAGAAQFFTSNNIACRRDRFLEIGGFDESFPLAAGEDREFGIRWRERGGRLIFVPEALVGHAHALDLWRFWRQHSNYGRGARHLHRVRSSDGRGGPALERAAFYAGLVLHPLTSGAKRPILKSVLMVLSQLAMTAGYAGALRQERRASR